MFVILYHVCFVSSPCGPVFGNLKLLKHLKFLAAFCFPVPTWDVFERFAKFRHHIQKNGL